MKYSTESPKVPGYYWMRYHSEVFGQIVLINFDPQGAELCVRYDYDYEKEAYDYLPVRDHHNALWCGPLEEPE